MIMHKEIMKKVRFFRNKPPHFIAFIGPLLRPLRVEGGHFVFKEGDPIEHIFFLIKGDAAYVNIHINKEQPLIYMRINPGYNFGEIDFVYSKYKNLYENHAGNQFVGDVQAELGIPRGDGPMRRAFTVQAILPGACDILTISKADLQKVEADFEDMVSELFLDSYKKIRKML
jgi:CRP-like cAMP-binding protein